MNQGLPRIAVLTPQFLEFDGGRCLFGGGERYLVDLVKLLRSEGYAPEVYQPSVTGSWKKEYDGIQITGIEKGEVTRDFYSGVNLGFRQLAGDCDYHLYFNMDMTFPFVFPGSVCISHGVWWDSREREWWRTPSWYDCLFQGLDGIKTLVCVDTNTLHWIDAVNPGLNCHRRYIPNYVDLDLFRPDREPGTGESIRILYPRRLNRTRGWFLCLELALELLRERDGLSFSFVGRGSPREEEYMRYLASKNPRIEYAWYDMKDMPLAYRDTDIVLIPSLSSEGTSFSLLEAMACGKAVVAGLTGGLTDIILQGYNGCLVEPEKAKIKASICQLLDDTDRLRRYGNAAKAVSQCFSKELWANRWRAVLTESFPK